MRPTETEGSGRAKLAMLVGFIGLIFSVGVLTLDTSRLRDTGVAYAFPSSPYIITAFAGPTAAEHSNNKDWRWCYGTFANVLPLLCVPFYCALVCNKSKARAAGRLQPAGEQDHRTPLQWITWFAVEFDPQCDTMTHQLPLLTRLR